MWASNEIQIRQIMDEWQQELRRPDLCTRAPKRIKLLQRALELFTKDEKPIVWANWTSELGRTYAEDRTGDWGTNIRRAIEAFNSALTIQTKETTPESWALTVVSLAGALCELDDPENKRNNIEKAISLYEQVSHYYSDNKDLFSLADTQTDLAAAYLDRVQGDRLENIEKSIKLIKRALTVLNKYNEPREWLKAMANLGIAYHYRIKTEPELDNLEKAIECFEKSLEISASDPVQKAMILLNFSTSLSRSYSGI